MDIKQPVRLTRKAECYVIEQGNGLALAYIYFEDEPGRRTQTGRMLEADALEVARTIARALSEGPANRPSNSVEAPDHHDS